MKRVITFGTFDVLHIGHVRILERAWEMGDHLVVGVSSDALNFSKKGRSPVYSQDQRMKIVSSLKFVDNVFVEESLELKGDYIQHHAADLLVMGGQVRSLLRHLRGEISAPHALDLHDRDHRDRESS